VQQQQEIDSFDAADESGFDFERLDELMDNHGRDRITTIKLSESLIDKRPPVQDASGVSSLQTT